MRRVYGWLLMFAYRRLAKAVLKPEAGLPLMRDPDSPCNHYAPRDRQAGDWHDCQGDGHYLCRQCCHFRWRSDHVWNCTVQACGACGSVVELDECACGSVTCGNCCVTLPGSALTLCRACSERVLGSSRPCSESR
jgi:hypothetical protein